MLSTVCDPNYEMGVSPGGRTECFLKCMGDHDATEIDNIPSCIQTGVLQQCQAFGGTLEVSPDEGVSFFLCEKGVDAVVAPQVDDECPEGYVENPFKTGDPDACVKPCGGEFYMGVYDGETYCFSNCANSMIQTENGCVVQAYTRHIVPVGVVVGTNDSGGGDDTTSKSNNAGIYAAIGVISAVALIFIIVASYYIHKDRTGK